MRTLSALVACLVLYVGIVASRAEPLQGAAPQLMNERFVPEPRNHTVKTWVDGLEAPWSLVFLPDGRALVSERPGRIRLVVNGRLMPETVFRLEVARGGEGGLLGLAVHPRFPAEPYLYAMYTVAERGARLNKVARLRLEGNQAKLDRVLLNAIPGAANHNGGRIAFGPDGLLYIGTGDTFDAAIAQEPKNLGGKILRITADGGIPPTNPFPGTPVYSLGHRNVQSLAWHPETRELFAAEHGPSGEFLLFGHDEVNVIQPGRNYGWPLAVGAPKVQQFVDPIISWNDITTPPSGMTFWRGALYIATLASESLVRIELERSGAEWRAKEIDRWFADGGTEGRYGRIRDAVVGPDGALYVLTSNRDGRGTVRDGDDRILRIAPE